MNDGKFQPLTDSMDDLPRTFRREKEAREREARERAQREQMERPVYQAAAYGTPEPVVPYDAPLAYGGPEPQPAIVTRFNVPFFSLMAFFLKAVVAAIPALILLLAILYGVGIALKTFFPWLVQMEVLIRIPPPR